ncbi:hypothetical protein CsSME_00003020 [Camellia sinensis var. sinensis]
MSFLDAYRGYHQIAMYPPDEEKTAFITPKGLYCYKVMPFGLKNAGATYQRLVTKMFKHLIGKTVEVYIDDMVVKTKKSEGHLADLKEVFDILKRYRLRLNASKCAFGVGSGKFLGYLVTRKGIEASPDQIKAILELQSPTSAKQVQVLTGRAAALNKFISRSSDKCRPFFNLVKKATDFLWTKECEAALADLKKYLTTTPVLSNPVPGEELFLYLAVSEHAVSAVLIREEKGEQKAVYYVSKTLADAETRYLPLEKLMLALVMASKKLSHYFQAHKIVVLTEHPLKSLLHQGDLTGRIAKWAVTLGQFDLEFRPRTAIKGQVLADFVAELTPEAITPRAPSSRDEHHPNKQKESQSKTKKQEKEKLRPCSIYIGDSFRLFVDGSSNRQGAGAGVLLISPDGEIVEQSIHLGFKASNDEAEYEALITGLKLAASAEADEVIVFCDSQLIVNQSTGEFAARDERMSAYAKEVVRLAALFQNCRLLQVSRDDDTHANALANLASSIQTGKTRTIMIDYMSAPSIDKQSTKQEAMCVDLGPSWMDAIIAFLKEEKLPEDHKEAHKIRLKSARFILTAEGHLYRRSFTGPLLRCVHPLQVEDFLYEIHEGICRSHAGGRSLAHRAITQGYW